MIQVFAGEFLFHPAAVEISGNHCSHNCCYCFAHTRGSGRVMKLQSVINRLKRRTPKVYLDWLIKLGYPICLSNWTDPFSDNNYIQTNALAYHLATMPNGLFIQTKGGKGIDEFIDIMGDKKNIVWYVTITTDNDELAVRTEPNAPSPTERLALVKKLHELGYVVTVGINPLCEAWTPYEDFTRLADKIKAIGVKNIFIEPLHINNREYCYYSDKRKTALGVDVNTLETDEHRAFMLRCFLYLNDNGFNPCLTRMPYASDIFAEIRRGLGGKMSFNNYEFYSYCYTLPYKEGRLITLQDYLGFMQKGNEEIFDMEFDSIDNDYVLRYAFNLWKGNPEMQGINTFRKLFTAIWNKKEFRNSPQHNLLFRLVTDCKDAEGNVLLWFNGVINTPDNWEISINQNGESDHEND